jgi:hypothetical protein
MKKEYLSDDGRFRVAFDELPALVPKLLNTQFDCWFDRWRGAADLRRFMLHEDWRVEIQVNPSNFDHTDLSGTYIIPVTYRQQATILDGASVPMPWLVSFLSFGLLRPVGVMLTASIVHDFAFQHGVLQPEGTQDPVTIPRHLADRLFGRMIATVNRLPVVGVVGWLAVRLGWIWVPYAGKRWGRPVPWLAFAVLALVLASLVTAFVAALTALGPLGPLLLISGVVAGYLLGYLILWLAGPPS